MAIQKTKLSIIRLFQHYTYTVVAVLVVLALLKSFVTIPNVEAATLESACPSEAATSDEESNGDILATAEAAAESLPYRTGEIFLGEEGMPCLRTIFDQEGGETGYTFRDGEWQLAYDLNIYPAEQLSHIAGLAENDLGSVFFDQRNGLLAQWVDNRYGLEINYHLPASEIYPEGLLVRSSSLSSDGIQISATNPATSDNIFRFITIGNQAVRKKFSDGTPTETEVAEMVVEYLQSVYPQLTEKRIYINYTPYSELNSTQREAFMYTFRITDENFTKISFTRYGSMFFIEATSSFDEYDDLTRLWILTLDFWKALFHALDVSGYDRGVDYNTPTADVLAVELRDIGVEAFGGNEPLMLSPMLPSLLKEHNPEGLYSATDIIQTE